MSQKNPTAPRPSTAEMQRRLGAELSPASRVLYAMLLFFALAVSGATISLLATEPELPTRTTLALSAIAAGGLCWAGLFGWTLTRRKVLLGRHRVLAGGLATVMSALFLAGSAAIAVLVPELRAAATGAAGFGVLLVIVAVGLWGRARRRQRELEARRDELQARISASRASIWLLAALFLTTVPTAPALHAQTLATDGIEVEAAASPIPVAALGRLHLAYELHLTNMGTTPRRVEVIGVSSADGTDALAAWAGPELDRRLSTVGAPADRDRSPRLLAPGTRAIAFLWVTLEAGVRTTPRELRHRIVSVADDGSDRRILEGAVVAIEREAEPLDRAPVGAGRWVTLRAPSAASVHRRAVVTLDGSTRIPTRFAVDWARLGEDGRLYRGAGEHNEDWYGYGEPVRAAHPGVVVRVIDGLPEHAPRSPELRRAFERETVTGNTVVVDHGNGRHAVYAHLQPGSIPVAEGERVAAGDPVGRIGNSGLSLAPHLHFHVVADADPMAAEGVPFRLAEYRLIGRVASFGATVAGTPWTPDPRRPARTVHGETPLENMVVEIGDDDHR